MRAERVASQLVAGRVMVNGFVDEPMAPFGGFKQSGIGRELGVEAMIGARYRFLRVFEVGLAGGPGFGGAGTPDVRGVAMLANSPPDRTSGAGVGVTTTGQGEGPRVR